MEFKPNSLEERIFRLLHTKYPITVDEVQKELKVSPRIVEHCLKKMAVRGIIEFDVLPDKTFIRLQVMDKEYIAKDSGKIKERRGGEPDPAYG